MLSACILSHWNTAANRLLDLVSCLPHKYGEIPISAFHKYTTSKLAGVFSRPSLRCLTSSREAVNTVFSLQYESTRESNPRLPVGSRRCNYNATALVAYTVILNVQPFMYAYELMLYLLLASHTESSRRIDCSTTSTVYHLQMKISCKMLYSRTQQANLKTCFNVKTRY